MSTVAFMSIPDETAAGEAATGEPECAGSGTLARVGDNMGIVTAAHVVELLKKFNRVGVVNLLQPQRTNRLAIDLNYVREVTIRNSPWSENGPDIAFLVLPTHIAGNLEDAGCTFINLNQPADMLRQRQAQAKGFWCTTGAVAESFTRSGSMATGDLTVSVEATLEPGDAVSLGANNGFDRFRFVPDTHPEYTAPSTYGGMSGGGLWFAETDQESTAFVRAIFVGVNFWESAAGASGREIICHGFESVYIQLVQKI